jgi:hypothetical protein
MPGKCVGRNVPRSPSAVNGRSSAGVRGRSRLNALNSAHAPTLVHPAHPLNLARQQARTA